MNLEQHILTVVKRVGQNPCDSYYVCTEIWSDDPTHTKRHIQDGLQRLSVEGKLARKWVLPDDKSCGKWLYTLAVYAEPEKKLYDYGPVEMWRAAHKKVKDVAVCINGRIRPGRQP